MELFVEVEAHLDTVAQGITLLIFSYLWISTPDNSVSRFMTIWAVAFNIYIYIHTLVHIQRS